MERNYRGRHILKETSVLVPSVQEWNVFTIDDDRHALCIFYNQEALSAAGPWRHMSARTYLAATCRWIRGLQFKYTDGLSVHLSGHSREGGSQIKLKIFLPLELTEAKISQPRRQLPDNWMATIILPIDDKSTRQLKRANLERNFLSSWRKHFKKRKSFIKSRATQSQTDSQWSGRRRQIEFPI